MRSLTIAVALMLSILQPATAATGARSARVHLFSVSPIKQLRIVAAPPVSVDADMQRSQSNDAVTLQLSARGSTIAVGPKNVRGLTITSPHLELNDRVMSGSVTIRAVSNTLQCVATVPFEQYVAGVVSSEALPHTPAAALQAQAVCARSYAMALQPHATEGYDYCDSTHCQDFHGVPPPDDPAAIATRATAGQYLALNGRPLAAYYHSTCGGRTAGADEVFPAGPGIVSVIDGTPSFCAHSPHFSWTVHLAAARLRDALNQDHATAVGAVLSDVRVLSRGASGRALAVELRGSRTVRIGAYDLWLLLGRTLGWGQIESTWFEVHREAGQHVFVFSGHGLGHGLGLCQWGSAEMARRGRNMRQILAHYFPRATLQLSNREP
jgi:stage II sporulation protein D